MSFDLLWLNFCTCCPAFLMGYLATTSWLHMMLLPRSKTFRVRGKGDYQIDYVPAPRITEADKANDRKKLLLPLTVVSLRSTRRVQHVDRDWHPLVWTTWKLTARLTGSFC